MVEQERKQEVSAVEPQVVLRRPVLPIGGCLNLLWMPGVKSRPSDVSAVTQWT